MASNEAEVLLSNSGKGAQATMSEVSTDVSSAAAAAKKEPVDNTSKSLRESCTVNEAARLGKELWDSPKFLKVMLGLSPGATSYFYLASIGYFSQKFDNPALFSLQLFVSGFGFFAVSVLMQNSSQMEREMDAEHGLPFMITVRFVFTGFLMSALTMLVPMCANIGHVLVLGMSISLLIGYIFNQALDLATVIDPTGSSYVQIGYVLGGLLVIPTAWAVGFEPGCTDLQAILFYTVPASFVVFTSLFYALHHYNASRRAFSSQASASSSSAREYRGGAAMSTADVLPQAYQSMKYGSMVSGEESTTFSVTEKLLTLFNKSDGSKDAVAESESRESALRLAHNTAMKFLVWLSFFPQVFYTLLDPQTAQSFFLTMIIGSVLGRFVALWHTNRIRSQGVSEGPWYRLVYSTYMAARWVMVAAVIRYMLYKGQGSYQPSEDAVFVMVCLIWATGTHIHGVADIDGVSSVAPSERKPVMQWLVTAGHAGNIAGLTIGCIWMALLTEETYFSPASGIAAPASAAALGVGKAALVGLVRQQS